MRTQEPGYEQRFGGIVRLFGADKAERLRAARFCVVGVGGVGSWAAEALARSGIGELVLVDLDDVCITNTNRQLPALEGQIGRPKVEVLRERFAAIDPECRVEARPFFYSKSASDTVFNQTFDCVIDAIDVLTHKCELLADCRKRGVPIVTTGGAGGKLEPTRIQVADLSETSGDALLRHVRKQLRSQYDFPATGTFGIPCVFSEEEPVLPWREEGCAPNGTRLDCAGGLGAGVFVTAPFGFAAAREAIRLVVG